MKRWILAALALALLLPALAVADTYAPGDNILLDTGIPYGNYGYQGLAALYDGDMDAVDGHMRSKHSNQQGGGEGGVRGSVVRMAPLTLEGWMAKNGYGFYVPTSYTNLGTYLSYENNGEIANLDLNKVSV